MAITPRSSSPTTWAQVKSSANEWVQQAEEAKEKADTELKAAKTAQVITDGLGIMGNAIKDIWQKSSS